MNDSKTATERLRELLNERGVEWKEPVTGYRCDKCTNVVVDDVIYRIRECDGGFDVDMEVCGLLTPEQAIAATLGSGTLTAEQVKKAIKKHAQDTSCYIYEVYGEMCGAIADELNAVLGKAVKR